MMFAHDECGQLPCPTYPYRSGTDIDHGSICLGIPAITTNVGGCPEIVTDRENGLLVPVGNIRALALP